MRERGEETVRYLNSFFSYSLCPAAALSHPSRKWEGALTTAVSSSSQCALQKGQTTLPGNLGTRRRRVNVGVLQGKPCSEWGDWRAAFARSLLKGCFPLLECSREGSRVTKSYLWLSRRVVVGGTSLEMTTKARNKPVVKRRVFSSVWSMLGSSAPGYWCLGEWFYSSPALCALEEPQEETKLLVWRQPALSLFTRRGRLLCTATYLPAREGCLHNGDLTDCICFVLV